MEADTLIEETPMPPSKGALKVSKKASAKSKTDRYLSEDDAHHRTAKTKIESP